MSGKFKKDVARSQTLSQISCFSSFDHNEGDFEKDKSLGLFFVSQDAHKRS